MRGITPVVAVVLLLLITISIVGFVMVFFQRTAESAAAAGETQLQSQVSAMGENFDIVSIDGNKVYIRNLGAGTLGNVGFYVDGVVVQNTSVVSIPASSISEITLNASQLAMLPGDKLRVTSAGHQAEQDANFYEKSTAAYWRFDEADGRTIKDYSGNGNDGTFSGESWNDGTINGATQAAGRYGNALGFDGVNDYVSFPGVLNTAGTAEVWVKWLRNSAGYGAQDLFADFIWQHPANNYFYTHSWSGAYAYFAYAIPLNTWTHLAFTWTNSNDASTLKLYADGVLYAPNPGAGGYGSIAGLSGLAYGGAFGGNYLNALIDEVRIYNRALTQQEIIEDMNSAYPVNRTVASYSFNKVIGNIANDTHNVVKGRYGAALSFDGVDDYVDAGTDSSLGFTTENFSIEAWINPTTTDHQGIFSKYTSGGSAGYMFWLYGGGYLFMNTGPDGGQVWSDAVIVANQWQHVAVVRDGTSDKFYVNGVQRPTSITTAHTNIAASTISARIGVRSQANNNPFGGKIDEVRILNAAL